MYGRSMNGSVSIIECDYWWSVSNRGPLGCRQAITIAERRERRVVNTVNVLSSDEGATVRVNGMNERQ
jgi:hypothetical protein